MRRQFMVLSGVFVSLALVYLVLILSTSGSPSTSVTTLVSAVFGGALAFFLVRLFQIAETARWEI